MILKLSFTRPNKDLQGSLYLYIPEQSTILLLKAYLYGGSCLTASQHLTPQQQL
jgi:hypothetical protein